MRGEAKIDLQGRRTDEGTFAFGFDVTEDTRKAKPYAARVVLDGGGDLGLEYFEFDEDEEGRHVVRVSGEYEASAGDLVEECSGGSWKNVYVSRYVVSSAGEKVEVWARDRELRKYLRGEVSAVDLLPEHHRESRAKLVGGRRQELEAERARIEGERARLRGELERVRSELAAEAAAETVVSLPRMGRTEGGTR